MLDETHELVPIDFDPRWLRILQWVKDQFGKKPNLEGLLFLIGMQVVGKPQTKYTKEQKQDLMHVAVCHLLSIEGYYELVAYDADGWPHYEALKTLANLDLEGQETLLKQQIIRYFEQLNIYS